MRLDAQHVFRSLEEGFRVHIANTTDAPDYKKSVMIYWAGVRALAGLCELTPQQKKHLEDLNEKVQRPFGITDAIRSILFLAEDKLTALQVRDALVEMGFDMRKYSFPMGSVHGTLRTLVRRGEVTMTVLRDDSKLYEWNEAKVRKFFKPKNQPAAAR